MKQVPNEIVKINSSAPFSHLVISLKDEGPITKTNCKICMCEKRDEIEKFYVDNGSNIKATYRFMTDKLETKISYPSCQRHFRRHYERQMIHEAVREYAASADQYRLQDISLRSSLEDRRTILNKNLMEISALSDDANLEMRLKASSEANKISSAMSLIEQQILELNQKYEPINILMDILGQSVYKHMEENKDKITDEFKEILVSIINEVKDKADEIKGEED